jgi:fatty acid desaturase
MIAGRDARDKPPRMQAPLQPMGWPSGAHWNAANQARQELDAQRRRNERLAQRNRRLVAALAASWMTVAIIGLVLLALGLLFGYAVGVGLIGLVSR